MAPDLAALGTQAVGIIDQRALPHEFTTMRLNKLDDACMAIADMAVRGAPLIGATAAYGLCLSANDSPAQRSLRTAGEQLCATRPTAVNLRWAVERMLANLDGIPETDVASAAWRGMAATLCDEDVEINYTLGKHGCALIRKMARTKKGGTVNILTHCNAGWLACVDWGTATSSIYQAFDAGIDVHVWVDETRPRNQGASLTAWELGRHGVPQHGNC